MTTPWNTCTPLLGALDHADMDLEGVAGAEVGHIVAEAVLVDEVGAVHGVLPGQG